MHIYHWESPSLLDETNFKKALALQKLDETPFLCSASPYPKNDYRKHTSNKR